ncbi:MAG: hypothetical protein ACJAZX_001601 [Rickettsiales bacterium]|jgi:hypothetical protein
MNIDQRKLRHLLHCTFDTLWKNPEGKVRELTEAEIKDQHKRRTKSYKLLTTLLINPIWNLNNSWPTDEKDQMVHLSLFYKESQFKEALLKLVMLCDDDSKSSAKKICLEYFVTQSQNLQIKDGHIEERVGFKALELKTKNLEFLIDKLNQIQGEYKKQELEKDQLQHAQDLHRIEFKSRLKELLIVFDGDIPTIDHRLESFAAASSQEIKVIFESVNSQAKSNFRTLGQNHEYHFLEELTSYFGWIYDGDYFSCLVDLERAASFKELQKDKLLIEEDPKTPALTQNPVSKPIPLPAKNPVLFKTSASKNPSSNQQKRSSQEKKAAVKDSPLPIEKSQDNKSANKLISQIKEIEKLKNKNSLQKLTQQCMVLEVIILQDIDKFGTEDLFLILDGLANLVKTLNQNSKIKLFDSAMIKIIEIIKETAPHINLKLSGMNRVPNLFHDISSYYKTAVSVSFLQCFDTKIQSNIIFPKLLNIKARTNGLGLSFCGDIDIFVENLRLSLGENVDLDQLTTKKSHIVYAIKDFLDKNKGDNSPIEIFQKISLPMSDSSKTLFKVLAVSSNLLSHAEFNNALKLILEGQEIASLIKFAPEKFILAITKFSTNFSKEEIKKLFSSIDDKSKLTMLHELILNDEFSSLEELFEQGSTFFQNHEHRKKLSHILLSALNINRPDVFLAIVRILPIKEGNIDLKALPNYEDAVIPFLRAAFFHGNCEIIELIFNKNLPISKRIELLNLSDRDGDSLIVFLSNSTLKAVELVFKDFDGDQCFEVLKNKNPKGVNFIMYAVQEYNVQIANFVLNKLSPDQRFELLKIKSVSGFNAAMMAAQKGQNEVLGAMFKKFSYEQYFDIIQETDVNGLSIIEYAISSCEVKNLIMLIKPLNKRHLLSFFTTSGIIQSTQSTKEHLILNFLPELKYEFQEAILSCFDHDEKIYQCFLAGSEFDVDKIIKGGFVHLLKCHLLKDHVNKVEKFTDVFTKIIKSNCPINLLMMEKLDKLSEDEQVDLWTKTNEKGVTIIDLISKKLSLMRSFEDKKDMSEQIESLGHLTITIEQSMNRLIGSEKLSVMQKDNLQKEKDKVPQPRNFATKIDASKVPSEIEKWKEQAVLIPKNLPSTHPDLKNVPTKRYSAVEPAVLIRG